VLAAPLEPNTCRSDPTLGIWSSLTQYEYLGAVHPTHLLSQFWRQSAMAGMPLYFSILGDRLRPEFRAGACRFFTWTEIFTGVMLEGRTLAARPFARLSDRCLTNVQRRLPGRPRQVAALRASGRGQRQQFPGRPAVPSGAAGYGEAVSKYGPVHPNVVWKQCV